MDALTPSQRCEIDEQAVVTDLATMSYEDTAAKHGTSRGKVWKIAVKHRARKFEDRIAERAADQKRRRQEFLREVLESSVKSDVLDFLEALPDESINLHVTSCPYNLGKPYGGSRATDRHRARYFRGWLQMVMSEMTRTLKPGGVMFLNVGKTREDDGSLLPMDCFMIEELRAMGLTYQSRVVWEIPHGLTPKTRLAERHEVCIVVSKGEPACFNATAARVPQKQPGKRAFKGPSKGQLSCHPLGAHPTDVWRGIGNVGHNHPERAKGGGHPAQFPQELARRAILLWTRPEDVVADVFSGSGTTQVEARRTGRAFVGCDLFYERERERRLATIVPDLVTALPGVTAESVAVWAAEARGVTVPALPADYRVLELETEQLVLEM